MSELKIRCTQLESRNTRLSNDLRECQAKLMIREECLVAIKNAFDACHKLVLHLTSEGNTQNSTQHFSQVQHDHIFESDSIAINYERQMKEWLQEYHLLSSLPLAFVDIHLHEKQLALNELYADDNDDCNNGQNNVYYNKIDANNMKDENKINEENDMMSTPKTLRCKLCGRKNTTDEQVLKHESCHAIGDDIKCCETNCDFMTQSIDSIRAHIKEVDIKKRSNKNDYSSMARPSKSHQVKVACTLFICKYDCGAMFEKANNLRSHEEIHKKKLRNKINAVVNNVSEVSFPFVDTDFNQDNGEVDIMETSIMMSTPSNENMSVSQQSNASPSNTILSKGTHKSSNFDQQKKYFCQVKGCTRGFTNRSSLRRHEQNIHFKRDFVLNRSDDANSCPTNVLVNENMTNLDPMQILQLFYAEQKKQVENIQ